ncbi:MAG: hypothetical protein A2Y84_01940 [Candidatus Colwellbacteria bacterium RBG_13_48_8]|uniref:DUF1761 domain-containing protein n=1 Tax=Candidatus Colwellbacteria bacterium RBG_13_48_8 TaxID=1797685 RepID=A0A1G1YX95_9BACT|nr:MAG: hypothetical protein A2Y84_01940 [Candidatus Colwellbacteria bacterium RBG_13_48_8]
MLNVSLGAVVVAGLANLILRVVWYSRILGGRWVKRDSRSGISKIYLPDLIIESFMVYALAYLMALTGSYSFLTLSELALLTGLGFFLAVFLDCAFTEGKTWQWVSIVFSHRLISLFVAGGIIIALT